MLIAQATYLNSTPDLKSMLLTMGALTAVSAPLATQLPWGVIGVFVFFLLLRLGLLMIGVYALKTWQLMILMVGMTALVWQQLGTVIGLGGGAAFLLMLSLLKSFEGKTRRDWQVLILAMMFLLAAAILFDQGLLMGLWTVLCLVLMAVSLAMLNDLSFQAALKNSLVGFLLALLPMVMLFVGMPRRETPFWGMPQIQNERQATTGMSDTMKPGSISDLVESNEPVFSVTFEDGYVPQQRDLYWRVMMLANHNGSEWQAVREFMDSAVPVEDNRHRVVRYNIMMEDDKGRVPALDYPLDTNHQRGLRREAGDMVRVFSRAGVRRFTLRSSISDELPHQLDQFFQQRYTRLPENLNPRTRALAQQLWQESGGNAEQYIQAAYLYFKKQGFAYTLKPPLLNSVNTTDEFIFSSKQGFCEHYSDAFVMLMRAAGLPARVVVGYQGGEFNEEGGFWQIRSKDAHAWAEVWLPEKQVWKRVDPTSAVAANRIDGSIDEALSGDESGISIKNNAFTRYLDQGRYYWQAWIVDYDSNRQQTLFSYLGFERVTPLAIIIVMGGGVAIALIPLWLWWRRSRSNDILPLEHGFILLKRRVLGKDFGKLASLAPTEFRAELAAQNRLPEDLDNLIQEYIRLRYASSHEPSPAIARAWYQRAQKLARKYAHKPTAPQTFETKWNSKRETE